MRKILHGGQLFTDEETRILEHIQTGSYSAMGQHPNGYLFVELNFAKWEGRTGAQLLWEAMRMLWRIFHDKLRSRFTPETGKELA